MPIPNHVKQACRLSEAILSAVALADLYSKEAKSLAIEEVKGYIADEPEGKLRDVLEAYLVFLQAE
jgi:hypothetical protein